MTESKTYTMELTLDEISYLLGAVYSVSVNGEDTEEIRALKFKLIDATLAGKRNQQQ